jgi:hypothetical protein
MISLRRTPHAYAASQASKAAHYIFAFENAASGSAEATTQVVEASA